MADAEYQSEHKSASEQEADDLETASHSTAYYAQFTPLKKPKKKWPRVVGWSVLAILVVAGLGAGGWRLMQQKPSAKVNQTVRQTTKSTATDTKAYTSNNLNLGFNYPKTWAVVDSGNGKLTVISPAMKLTDASGQTQTGQVVMTIQNENSADFSAFKTGSAVAVLDSIKLAYAKPASTQRANTYISFLQYADTTIRGALDSVYVTGNAGYRKDQAIPESDITKIDPFVAVSFVKCGNAGCSGATTPMSIASTMWSNTSFAAPIENMMMSLTIQ
jgi:hypothetical protein